MDEEHIREEAYRRWLADGQIHGRDLEHWSAAEWALRQQASAAVGLDYHHADIRNEASGEAIAEAGVEQEGSDIPMIITHHKTILVYDASVGHVVHVKREDAKSPENIVSLEERKGKNSFFVRRFWKKRFLTGGENGKLILAEKHMSMANSGVTIEPVDAGVTVSLNGLYLTAERNGEVAFSRSRAKEWEIFRSDK